MDDRALVGADALGGAVDGDDALAGIERDGVFVVPGERVEKDLAGVGDAAEHVRQQDAVVVAVGLVAENGDVEHRRTIACEDLLDGADAGHAVADDDEALAELGDVHIHECAP